MDSCHPFLPNLAGGAPGWAGLDPLNQTGTEARYLAAASSLLSNAATVLFDTGLPPQELFRLRWESITWLNGRNGTRLVTNGKTKAARRLLPMTLRVRHILETRWNAKGRPSEGYVWPALTTSGHIEPSSLKKQHDKALTKALEGPSIRSLLASTYFPHALGGVRL
jgi:integrase